MTHKIAPGCSGGKRDDLARRAAEAEREWLASLQPGTDRPEPVAIGPTLAAEVRARLLQTSTDEASGGSARSTLRAADLARARHLELERLRPRRRKAYIPAGLERIELVRDGDDLRWPSHDEAPNEAWLLDTNRERVTKVTPALARDAAALRALFDFGEFKGPRDHTITDGIGAEVSNVYQAIVRAIEAAKVELRDAWIDALLHELVNVRAQRLAATLDAALSPDVKRTVFDAYCPATALSRARSRFGALSPVPAWVTEDVVAWLLEHFSPTRPGSSGGGGRPRKGSDTSKLNEASIRALLNNRHELEKKLRPAKPR